jgi:hypothetical protein
MCSISQYCDGIHNAVNCGIFYFNTQIFPREMHSGRFYDKNGFNYSGADFIKFD